MALCKKESCSKEAFILIRQARYSFKNVSTIISDNKIELNEVELGQYVTTMKNFWNNVFHQAM